MGMFVVWLATLLGRIRGPLEMATITAQGPSWDMFVVI